MPTLQIRLDEDSKRKIAERGGSPWARDILLEALTNAEPALELKPALPELKQEILGPKPEVEPLMPALHDGLCPRWMHHRHDIACALCGETL